MRKGRDPFHSARSMLAKTSFTGILEVARNGCLVACALAASGCQPRNQLVKPPPPQVTVALPLEQAVQEYFETTGRTAASQQVELRARVSGYLQEKNFKDGQLVEAGQLLFVIDKAPYQAAKASAQAVLQRAEAQRDKARRDFSRTEALVKSNATTDSVRDEMQAAQAMAEADVASGAAALHEAQLNLDYTEIHAPFAGRITESMLDVGNLVQPGTTHLATLQAVTPMHAYFMVNENDLLRFMSMLQSGELKISDVDPPEIELAFGDSDEFNFHGVLDYREFGLDPATGTARRRAVFDNADGKLIPGLFVRIRAAVGDPHPRLVVEERALGADQRGEYLLVVNDKDVVEVRTVQLGRLEGGLRAIESGLSPTDRVVINGLQRARPGTQVVPETATMGASLTAARPASEQPPAAVDAPQPTSSSASPEAPSPKDGEPAAASPRAVESPGR